MLLEKAKKSVYLCARCGYCRDMVRARDNTDLMCPLRETTSGFESFTARGRNWILRLFLEGRISPRDFSETFVDHLYSCLLCGNCTEHCLVLEPESWASFPENRFGDHLINNDEIAMALRNLVIEEGKPPVQIRKVLENIYRSGNPLGEPREKRDAFAQNIDFGIKNAAEERCEVLLYLGSIAPYSEMNQRAIQAVARILKAADVDFGILGAREIDSGGYARELGEVGLFEELARQNSELFRRYGIGEIVCLSPHDYHTFTNYYPEISEEGLAGIHVQHYTEFISDLIRNGRLRMRGNIDTTATFHDPCYLGRKNGIYDAPREILLAAGARPIEMRLSHANSYCCGGGGGMLWYEPKDKPRIENQRATQAVETGANILAVACPSCAQMLEDGMKAVGGKMKVKDVAEIVEEDIVH